MKSNIPDPCKVCEPQGGYWVYIEGRGMQRCPNEKCARGKMLAKGDAIRREYREDRPTVNLLKLPAGAIKAARQAAEALEDIPGCPKTESSMTFLADELMTMARTAEQLQWLVKRARRLYRRWPGSRELRVLFCSRFMPRDGYELHDSELYPEGIPSEMPAEHQNYKLLSAGRVVTIDAGMQREIAKAAELKSMEPKERKAK